MILFKYGGMVGGGGKLKEIFTLFQFSSRKKHTYYSF